MENANPKIKEKLAEKTELIIEDNKLININEKTIFELIRNIKDPEHPYTLEQLNVVSLDNILLGEIENSNLISNRIQLFKPLNFIDIIFTPTVPHCSMAGIIGLCIRRRLECFIEGIWIRVFIKEGSHSNEIVLNKQLNDKDRVMAAFENQDLLDILDSCINETC